jgi:hypothetical protein
MGFATKWHIWAAPGRLGMWFVWPRKMSGSPKIHTSKPCSVNPLPSYIRVDWSVYGGNSTYKGLNPLNPFKSSQTEQALGNKALMGYKKQPNLVCDSLYTASKKLCLHQISFLSYDRRREEQISFLLYDRRRRRREEQRTQSMSRSFQ